MTHRKTLAALALAAALAACNSERTSGRICAGGECTADLYVACFATDEVKGVTDELDEVTATFAVDDGPIALAFGGGGAWVSHSLGAPSLLRLAPGAPADRVTLGGGGDLQEVRVGGGLVYTTNSSVSTLAVVDPARGQAIDEVRLAPSLEQAVYPQGFDLVGDRAYVALYGSASAPSFDAGQEIAVVDLESSASCAAPPCGAVLKRLSLRDVPAAYDAPGYPFPSRVLRVGSKVYVTLSNLKAGSFGFYTEPAGSGRLAVVDTAAGDAVSVVDLGAACTNPGSLAADGDVLWVSCASGALVPVSTATTPPTAGAPSAMPAGFVPGQLAACRGSLYVTDQFSGTVLKVNDGAVTAELAACAASEGPFGFAWAADVECGP